MSLLIKRVTCFKRQKKDFVKLVVTPTVMLLLGLSMASGFESRFVRSALELAPNKGGGLTSGIGDIGLGYNPSLGGAHWTPTNDPELMGELDKGVYHAEDAAGVAGPVSFWKGCEADETGNACPGAA